MGKERLIVAGWKDWVEMAGSGEGVGPGNGKEVEGTSLTLHSRS